MVDWVQGASQPIRSSCHPGTLAPKPLLVSPSPCLPVWHTPEDVEEFSSHRRRQRRQRLRARHRVSIPRRVLRGFRGVGNTPTLLLSCGQRFNTPEGVEGFSSSGKRPRPSIQWELAWTVSIPRRVLRGFRGPGPSTRRTWPMSNRFQYPGGC